MHHPKRLKAELKLLLEILFYYFEMFIRDDASLFDQGLLLIFLIHFEYVVN